MARFMVHSKRVKISFDFLTENAGDSELANNHSNEDDENDITNALSRLKQEAQQAMAFGSRGIRDVTAEFIYASNQLAPGELIKDEYFTLFEAVGALEIMDPKMDSGYVAPEWAFLLSKSTPDYDQDDTLEPDFDPSAGLDAEQVMWIMDQLLCLEIVWLEGYPVSQTVFTSLHIDALLSPDKTRQKLGYFGDRAPQISSSQDALVHTVLRAYCIALVKCCQLALGLIQSQTYYEEEDFVTHLFGRDLLPEVGAETAVDLLDEAMRWISDRITPNHIKQAFLSRCRFRFTLLQILGGNTRQWDELIADLALIEKDHNFGKATPEAFSEKVQRLLATSTPPRPMIEISFDLACTKWTNVCEDCIAAYRLTSPDIIQTPFSLQRAVWAFSYRGQPGTLARALMQDILFADYAVAGKVSHYDLMLTDLRDMVLAGDDLADPESFGVEATSDPRHICSNIIRGFMEKAIDEYMNIYRMACQNRCRFRRTLTQAIPVFESLEQEAENADQELEKYAPSLKMKIGHQKGVEGKDLRPLQNFIYYQSLRILAWTVQFGFETDIYLPDEFGRMYRFLSILAVYGCRLLDHFRTFVDERIKKCRDVKRLAQCDESRVLLTSLYQSCDVTHSLSEALFQFYTLLIKLDIVKPPKRDFADRELLYEARFKPYLRIEGDDIPTLESFETDVKDQNKRSTRVVLSSIDQHLKNAKATLGELKNYSPEQAKFVGTEVEWKREIKQSETVCVAISVAASQLKRIREKVGTDDLGGLFESTFERKYHVWWVVPVLKET